MVHVDAQECLLPNSGHMPNSHTGGPGQGIMGERQCSGVGVLGAWSLSYWGPVTLLSRPHLSVWVCVLMTSQVEVLLEKGSGLEVKLPMLPLTRRETYPCQHFEVSEQPVSSAAGRGRGRGRRPGIRHICGSEVVSR